MNDEFDGEHCTVCGKPLNFYGASTIYGVCLHCVFGDRGEEDA